MNFLSFLILTTSISFIFANEEKYLSNIKRLTWNGTNAEAYFSYDGTKIIFQAMRGSEKCDQIYSMNVDGSDIKLIGIPEGNYFFDFLRKKYLCKFSLWRF
jgi:hypothetical protein